MQVSLRHCSVVIPVYLRKQRSGLILRSKTMRTVACPQSNRKANATVFTEKRRAPTAEEIPLLESADVVALQTRRWGDGR